MTFISEFTVFVCFDLKVYIHPHAGHFKIAKMHIDRLFLVFAVPPELFFLSNYFRSSIFADYRISTDCRRNGLSKGTDFFVVPWDFILKSIYFFPRIKV